MTTQQPSSWQSSFVLSNGTHLHVTRTGGDKPPLVLSHGVTDDGLCWSPFAAELCADYDVIMLDARGHGLSDAPESGYDTLTQAADLAGVLASLQLEKPILMGHSMGAVTTLALAALHPAQPRAVILEDPPPWWVPPSDDAGMAAAVEGTKAWCAHIRSLTRDEILAEGRLNSPRWSEAELGPWADAKLLFSPHVIGGVFSRRHTLEMDWGVLLPRLTCPILVLTASLAQGAALSPAGLQELQVLIPHLQSAHFPEAGHNIRRDQFTPCLQAVHRFLSELREEKP